MKAAFFTMLTLSVILGGIAYYKSPELPVQAIKSGAAYYCGFCRFSSWPFSWQALWKFYCPKNFSSAEWAKEAVLKVS